MAVDALLALLVVHAHSHWLWKVVSATCTHPKNSTVFLQPVIREPRENLVGITGLGVRRTEIEKASLTILITEAIRQFAGNVEFFVCIAMHGHPDAVVLLVALTAEHQW